jgi:small-conductance mechanosensitive channel
LAIVHKAIVFLLMFSVTVILARIASTVAGNYSRKAVGAERSVSIFVNFIRLSVYLVGLMVTLQWMGVSVAPILTALGVGGLALALALQDTLSNLFAGLQIVAVRKVKIGQYVKLDSGADGYVTDITWRYTEILSPANNTILVPNSKLANAIVTNFYSPDKALVASLEVTVRYGSDLAKVERLSLDIAKEVAAATSGMVPNTVPGVTFSRLTDLGIVYFISFQVQEYNDQFRLKHELIKRLQQRFSEEGIQFAQVDWRPVPANPPQN